LGACGKNSGTRGSTEARGEASGSALFEPSSPTPNGSPDRNNDMIKPRHQRHSELRDNPMRGPRVEQLQWVLSGRGGART
jgi:hypothetical protein